MERIRAKGQERARACVRSAPSSLPLSLSLSFLSSLFVPLFPLSPALSTRCSSLRSRVLLSEMSAAAARGPRPGGAGGAGGNMFQFKLVLLGR